MYLTMIFHSFLDRNLNLRGSTHTETSNDTSSLVSVLRDKLTMKDQTSVRNTDECHPSKEEDTQTCKVFVIIKV